MRTRNYFGTKAKKSKKTEDWVQFKRLRNHVTWCLRIAKRSYFEDLSVRSLGNPRKVWKEINRLLGTRHRRKVDSLKVKAGVIMDKQDIAEEFGSFFLSVVGTKGEDLDGVNPCDMVPVCESTFKFDMIEEEDVLKILQGLDPNKAVRVDGICSKLLKTVASGISRSLTSLFNTSLTSGKVPSEWRSALVTPVHKGGDNELTGNYQPVSMLPVVVKVFERLVHCQLYNYLQENKLLNPLQFGFRAGHTTQDVLVSMTDDWRKALDEDKLVGTIMLDLSKAFELWTTTSWYRSWSSMGWEAMS